MCVVSQYIIVSDLNVYDLQCGRHRFKMNRKRFTRVTKTHVNGWKAACTDSAKACVKFPKNVN